MTTKMWMSGRVSSMEWVTNMGGGLSGHRNAWRWGSSDVSSMRCNSILLLWAYSQEVLSLGVGVEVKQEGRQHWKTRGRDGFSGVYMGSAWGAEQRRHEKHLFGSAWTLKGCGRSGTEGEDQGRGSRTLITKAEE